MAVREQSKVNPVAIVPVVRYKLKNKIIYQPIVSFFGGVRNWIACYDLYLAFIL